MAIIISTIIEKFVEYAVEYTVMPIVRELGYPCFMSSNIEKLKSQVEMLKETRDSVQDMVDAATRNVEDIKPVVVKWLREVDDIIMTYEGIVNESRQVRLCSNLVQRHRLSKKARKIAEELPGMKEEAGNFDNGVSYNAHAPVGNSSAKVLDFLDFESRKSIMEQIMDALLDDSVNKIGVYGMGGVGKTMLVKEISRIVKVQKSLDQVVTLTVSQTPDFKSIQAQLADMLGLKFDKETIEGRAPQLHKRLEMEKSILIVFDDIWEPIDLQMIGIPIDEYHTRCKLLFTSRDKHVLSNEMYINKIFEIKVLEEDESWNLFKKIVGEIVETCDLKPIAIGVVKECAHLPIAITTVAKALRNKSSSIWKDALDQLKNPVAVNIKEMDKKVYSSVKLSYDYLQSKEVKLLFLFCSMFPEDFFIKVEDLHVFAMSMGFLHCVDTVAQGRCRITKLVDDLVSSSLLLQSDFDDAWVKMHDIVRDVAILIASNDDQIRTLSYVQRLKEWEEEKVSGNHTAVYLDVNSLKSSHQKLMLPKVQLLMLRGPLSNGHHELVETFFEEMKELKGLELEHLKVSLSLPSLYSFANVRLLHLLDCELGNIDMIGELKKLEILSFKGSNIIQIPMTIGELTQLKVFDLSYCSQLIIIPPNILSKLTRLEELSLETFKRWEGEELEKERRNASLTELGGLPHLSRLNLSIQDEKIMPKQLFSRELNLEKFKISIGSEVMPWDWENHRRMLFLKMESGSGLDGWIKMLLNKCEELHLEGSIGTRVLQYFELDENDSSHLKRLYVRNNLEFQHFIFGQNKPLRKILSDLEDLELENLENLESIIHGHVGELPFNNLRTVYVMGCGKLGALFYNCSLDDILNLEEISIWDCEMLEVIIAVMESKETTATTIEFTHLKSLRLEGIPRVRGFFSKIEQTGQLSIDNPEEIETSKISNHASFFSEEVLLPNLEELEIREANNLKTIWHNIIIPNSFSKLERVEIESCNNVEKVFPPNIMSILTCLEALTIKNCSSLKCIFEVQEPNTTTEKSIDLLSNLRRLELCNLPNLEFVWSKDFGELLIFENIELLSIQECPKLKRAYPIKVLEQQEDLQIDISQLKEILEKEKSVHTLDSNQFQTSSQGPRLQDGMKLFSKLKILNLSGSLDNNNSTHLPIEIVSIVPNLEKFEVRRMLVEEIFPNERLINVEEQKNTVFELWDLRLFELPKLTHLWKDDFEITSSLQNLKFLTVSGCGILDMLVPSSVSFRNLRGLTLDQCHKLTHLLSPSVTRTLVQLDWLKLEKCKRMTTIIAREAVGEGDDDEIVFQKLQTLTLKDLSELTSFHFGKCIIRFPCLEDVIIKNCPEIRVFSLGIISTPNLLVRKVFICDDIGEYKNGDSNEFVEDINRTLRQSWENKYDNGIQYLFKEKNLEEDQSDPPSSHVEE